MQQNKASYDTILNSSLREMRASVNHAKMVSNSKLFI